MIFDTLTPGAYKIIAADPPWDFATRSDKGRGDRHAESHYVVQDIDWIRALPVQKLAHKDGAVLLMWVTDTHLKQGLDVMDAWGFEYKTVGFHWAKLNRQSDGFFVGMGYYSRANSELCLLGTRGKKPLQRYGKGVRRLIADDEPGDPNTIVSRIREHSRKPDEFFTRVGDLYGTEAPRCELFAREPRAGWACWGNQTDKFVGTKSDVDDLI